MSTTAAVQADALLLQLVTATTVCGSFFILLVLSLVSFINSSSSSTSPLYSTLHTFGHNSIHNRPSVRPPLDKTRSELIPRGRYEDQNKPTENALLVCSASSAE